MLQATVNNKNTYSISGEDGKWVLNDTDANLDIQFQPNGLISVLYNNKSFTATLEKLDVKSKEMVLKIDGQAYSVAIKEPIDQLLSSMGLDLKAMKKAEPVKAPMPGMILKVLVEPGQQINKGDGLLILEAMKMENVLKAAGDGVIDQICVSKGDAVEKNHIMITLI